MGKDKKAKAAGKKARVTEKQNRKVAQREKKQKAKDKNDDSEAEDVDLDAVLAEYAKQQAQFLKVTEAQCEAPSPRSSATLLASPSNSNELFLFGGEYYNGATATFFNDLFVYLIDRDEWRHVTSPNSPLPRSGHAWCRGGNAGGIYLFGGEFSSPKQGTFYHYNDFWRLDPASCEWEKIETKGKGPPGRSGHRMTYFKNYILLFGGFQDTSQQTKYLQDLWVYDTQNFTWYNPVLPPATQKPDPRSSFSFLPNESGAALYGGYSRIRATIAAGKQTKGAQGSKNILKPMVHQDCFFLRIVPPTLDSLAKTPPAVRWERRKKPANAPNPPRAGATMAYHKGRGIMFGGVQDVEESEEGIDSEFFDGLFAWNVERNRYFPLTLRKPRAGGKKQQQQDRGGRRGRGQAGEDELLRNLAALETGKSLAEASSIELTKEDGEKPEKVEKTVMMEMPHPRFNAQLAVQDDVLYIFGGTFEQGDKEFTFDEMWAIDLGKLDGVKEIFKRELANWQGSEDEDSEDEDEDEDKDEYSEDDVAMEDGEEEGVEVVDLRDRKGKNPIQQDVQRKARRNAKEVTRDQEMDDASTDIQSLIVDETETGTESSLIDTLPHPRPFESLRDFFIRTSIQWQDALVESLQARRIAVEAKSVKELRKEAFDLSEKKWWDCREEIRALEDEQEEAGIGEVVSLAERGDGGGPGRRI